jgi:hypothetical protein
MSTTHPFAIGIRVIRMTGGDRIGNQGEVIELDGDRVRVNWDTEKLRTWIKYTELNFVTSSTIAACKTKRQAYYDAFNKKYR